MTKWAFDLSEDLGLPVLVRTVTRVSHARGNVLLDELPRVTKKPRFDTSRPRIALPVLANHKLLREKLGRAARCSRHPPLIFSSA